MGSKSVRMLRAIFPYYFNIFSKTQRIEKHRKSQDDYVNKFGVCAAGEFGKQSQSLLAVRANSKMRHLISQLIPEVSRPSVKRERWETAPNLYVMQRNCVPPHRLSMVGVT